MRKNIYFTEKDNERLQKLCDELEMNQSQVIQYALLELAKKMKLKPSKGK